MAQLTVSSILFKSFSLRSHSTYNPPSTTGSMRSERVQNHLGATAGLRYRNARPRTSFTERVSGGGEPHPESPDQAALLLHQKKKPPWRRSLTGCLENHCACAWLG